MSSDSSAWRSEVFFSFGPFVSAARSTRAVPRNAPDEEEDEDSFIDDDSEDPDNDSDYNPAPSDDSDGEDIKRLQREATAFLKKRK